MFVQHKLHHTVTYNLYFLLYDFFFNSKQLQEAEGHTNCWQHIILFRNMAIVKSNMIPFSDKAETIMIWLERFPGQHENSTYCFVLMLTLNDYA